MTIREKHQNLYSKYHWVWTPIVTLLMGYLGVDQYDKYEARQAVVTPVEVHIETGVTHAHGRVLSNTDITLMIDKAIEVSEKETAGIYKKLEAWETP